jgi:Uma2 family endonuclease
MSIAEKLITANEFGAMDDDRFTELVRGRIVEMTPPKPKHGKIVFRIARLVGEFVDEHDLGHWFGEAGVVTERNPDSVRAPDAAFTSYARLGREDDDNHYLQVPPELVFEVLSPTDRAADVLEKASEYLRFGVTVVCLVDPRKMTIQLHTTDGPPTTLGAHDTFEVPAILPGFRCQVADFFPRAKKA